MKHFLLEGEHLVPFAELMDLVPLHHAFLQKGYDEGHFLFSGPQIPAYGGFLVARAKSREELDALLAEEPFIRAKKCDLAASSNLMLHSINRLSRIGSTERVINV